MLRKRLPILTGYTISVGAVACCHQLLLAATSGDYDMIVVNVDSKYKLSTHSGDLIIGYWL